MKAALVQPDSSLKIDDYPLAPIVSAGLELLRHGAYCLPDIHQRNGRPAGKSLFAVK